MVHGSLLLLLQAEATEQAVQLALLLGTQGSRGTGGARGRLIGLVCLGGGCGVARITAHGEGVLHVIGGGRQHGPRGIDSPGAAMQGVLLLHLGIQAPVQGSLGMAHNLYKRGTGGEMESRRQWKVGYPPFSPGSPKEIRGEQNIQQGSQT